MFLFIADSLTISSLLIYVKNFLLSIYLMNLTLFLICFFLFVISKWQCQYQQSHLSNTEDRAHRGKNWPRFKCTWLRYRRAAKLGKEDGALSLYASIYYPPSPVIYTHTCAHYIRPYAGV